MNQVKIFKLFTGDTVIGENDGQNEFEEYCVRNTLTLEDLKPFSGHGGEKEIYFSKTIVDDVSDPTEEQTQIFNNAVS